MFRLGESRFTTQPTLPKSASHRGKDRQSLVETTHGTAVGRRVEKMWSEGRNRHVGQPDIRRGGERLVGLHQFFVGLVSASLGTKEKENKQQLIKEKI